MSERIKNETTAIEPHTLFPKKSGIHGDIYKPTFTHILASELYNENGMTFQENYFFNITLLLASNETFSIMSIETTGKMATWSP